MQSALMTDPISTVFGVCVWILQVIGDFTGMGYELANVAIFVVLHPGSDPRALRAMETRSEASSRVFLRNAGTTYGRAKQEVHHEPLDEAWVDI